MTSDTPPPIPADAIPQPLSIPRAALERIVAGNRRALGLPPQEAVPLAVSLDYFDGDCPVREDASHAWLFDATHQRLECYFCAELVAWPHLVAALAAAPPQPASDDLAARLKTSLAARRAASDLAWKSALWDNGYENGKRDTIDAVDRALRAEGYLELPAGVRALLGEATAAPGSQDGAL